VNETCLNKIGRQKIMQRMRFFDIKEDSMNWAWERSGDGGKSWQTNWLIHYKRK
jgi:hypothetical protein